METTLRALKRVCKSLCGVGHRAVEILLPPAPKPLEICVSKMSGTTVVFFAPWEWRVCDVKAKVEEIDGILKREQRLLTADGELQDETCLENAFGGQEKVYLSLLRRSPLQAEWLMKVENDAMSLKTAPQEVLEDAEIVLKAASVSWQVLWHASDSLFFDRNFLLKAVKLNWRVWIERAPQEMREDRQVTLAVLQVHGRALRHVAKQFYSDPEVILASMYTRVPDLFLEGGRAAFETLMREHILFVFDYAAAELRSNCEFMIAMLHKDWQTCDFASPELWENQDYVKAAVRLHGELLARAAETLRADRSIVEAAVCQDGRALGHASAELRKDKSLSLLALRQTVKAADVVDDTVKRNPWVVLVTTFLRCQLIRDRIDSFISKKVLALLLYFFPMQAQDASGLARGLAGS